MMKPALTIFVAFILATAFQATYAQPGTQNPAARPFYHPASQQPHPREVIKEGVKRMQAFLVSDAMADPALINLFLEKEIAPFFDFELMSSRILGPLGYRINEQQRRGITTMIKRTFLTAFASNLANYKGGKVNYMNISGNLNHGNVRVRLSVNLPNQYPTIIELRFALGPKHGWKIIDVSANGMSAVAHYRNYVRSVVQRSGIEALLQ